MWNTAASARQTAAIFENFFLMVHLLIELLQYASSPKELLRIRLSQMSMHRWKKSLLQFFNYTLRYFTRF